jgi:hypothetical protein
MFYDIPKMNYANMVERAKKPYRGSNATPLGYREYSARHFRPLQNEEGFALYYRHREVLDDVKDPDNKKAFAIVRPDNTIQFNNPTSAQSENMILRRILSAPVHHEKARGGTCIMVHQNERSTMHPMFRGLRIDMDTLKEHKPYELYIKTISRKVAVEYLKQYDEFKVASLTMFNSMNADGVNDLLTELRSNKKYHNDYFFECFEKKHYVDALMHFVLCKYNYWSWADVTLSRLVNLKAVVREALDKHFDEYALRNSDAPFKLKQVEGGKYFPTSKWGYVIVQDGKEMVRL